MLKTSVATRLISLTVLMTLLLASFPTPAAAAKEKNRGLEAKWAKLIATYHRQALIHDSAPRWVAQWLSDYRREKPAKKAEIQKDLAISNAAWGPVQAIVAGHRGFDANGHVVDRAAAQQSVKELSKALQRYIKSAKNIKAFLRPYQ